MRAPIRLPIFRHWLTCLSVVFVLGMLTACTVPRVPSGTTNSSKGSDTTDGKAEAAAVESTATPSPTPISTSTPGPTLTATPAGLTEADPARAATLIDEGQTLRLQSDLSGAEAAFIDAIAADPSSVPAHIGLAEVYLYWPQYWQQALATAETAASLAPEDPVAQAYLAWAQQGAHHFDDAWQTALRAVELGPENVTAQTALADILSSVYQIDEAYEHAQMAVRLDDQDAGAWSTLGSIAYTLENWDEAGDAYEQAAALEPEFFASHLLLARHEMNTTGDVEVALELLQPAVDVQPTHPWILSFLVDVAIERNDWATAEETCQQMLVANQPQTPYPDGYACMAGVLVVQERYADAEPYQVLAEALATPARRDISLLRMRLYNENDQCDKGRDLAQAWLDERPYSVLAVRMIGVSYLCEEDFEQAIEKFTEVVEKLPRSVADARLLANAYARAGHGAQARAALNKVQSFTTNNPLYYQGLYEVQLFLGQQEEAVKSAQRWQVLRPDSSDAKISIALAQLILGKVPAAQSAAQSALDEGATGSTLYAVLGETYSRQGDYEQAEEYLLKALAIADNSFLAHNFITTLYLVQGDCDKVAPHIQWLIENGDDEESTAQLQEILDDCRTRAARPTPDPATALDDEAVVGEAEALLSAVGVESRSVYFTKEEQQRNLLVAYSSDFAAASSDFSELEHEIALGLARLLPRIDSQPDGLILLSGSKEEPHNITYVPTQAALLWSNGELTDAEFEATWIVNSAADLNSENEKAKESVAPNT